MAKSKLTLLDVASKVFLKDLRTALTAPVDLLQSLANSFERERGFKLRGEEDLIKSWTSAGLDAATLADTYSVLGHLFDHGIANQKSPDVLLEELQALCSARNVPGLDERREVLRLILTPSDAFLERQAAIPWAENTLPNLVGLDSSAELRGAFRSSRSHELLGLLPIANLRLALKHDDDEKSQVRRIAMQLTEEDIDKLIDTLQRAKRRLSGLREYVRSTNVKVYDDIIRGQWKSD